MTIKKFVLIFISLFFLCAVVAGELLAEAVEKEAEEKGPQDIILFDRMKESRRESGGLSPVEFSHTVHAPHHPCDDCHSDIFIPELGKNIVSEQRNMDGDYCGFCHTMELSRCPYCHKEGK